MWSKLNHKSPCRYGIVRRNLCRFLRAGHVPGAEEARLRRHWVGARLLPPIVVVVEPFVRLDVGVQRGRGSHARRAHAASYVRQRPDPRRRSDEAAVLGRFCARRAVPRRRMRRGRPVFSPDPARPQEVSDGVFVQVAGLV